jgi:hypothetical protein
MDRECEAIIATAHAAASSIDVIDDGHVDATQEAKHAAHRRDSSALINGHSRYGIFGPPTELELGTELVLNEDLKKPMGEHGYDSDAPPIARQIRCAFVRNRRRHTEAAR